MINVFQPSFGDEELAAVREVLESRWVGHGPRVKDFEEAFARHLGVSTSNVVSADTCTTAAFTVMELLGLGPGDEVVMPSIGFVGIANAVAARGATNVFCDVDPHSLNPRLEDVEKALTANTRAVVVLHYGGAPGHIAEIARLCQGRGIALVEDAANAQASRVDGQACGTFGDFGFWSFDHGKIAVAVDGGMLYAKEPGEARRAAERLYLGMDRSSGFSQARNGGHRWWEFDVSSFSRRSVMNDLTAAIGRVQLTRLDGFVERRRELASVYDLSLSGVSGVRTPPPLPRGHESSHYLYWIQTAPEIRDAVAADLYAHGVYTTMRYHPLHRIAAYGSTAVLPDTDSAAASTLCLPLHQEITEREVRYITEALADSVAKHSRSDG
ncbi:DegT/DnrJ/EryC1/StrS aminotransferase family protein [Nocardiopsis sp. B62]|uniref:DegT/DnrJ/EryC1/StrS family aminotransferase n=1 Tax=Nocardiopsis sp. B62 TaxID=2824874 RepID=UPI001B3655BD|nr:DegT/DnrJ/EryC1/StrS family aminotransferase [Nocardiopsis sp. B62]MBQ1080611.1 DegT/DnrJ/EryC1/StrS family aminotransferase [Nocardiopsis sp. B62]